MRIAIAIPLRDEEASIEALLDSLLAQSRPPDEIVVADGGSIDRTVERVERRIDRGEPVKLVQIGPAFPGRGRNEAVRATDCDWIAFTDGGVRADRRWLEKLAARAEARPEVDLVLGNFEPRIDTFFHRSAAVAYVPARRIHRDGSGWRGHFIASSLVRRSLWEAVGGFPEDLRSAEDLIFLEAARRHVGEDRVAVVPEATIEWQIAGSFEATLRRFRTYARYDLIAGRFNHWHRALVWRYALLLAASAATGPAAPATFTGLAISHLAARSLLSMKRKPEFVDDGLVPRAKQFAATAAILGVLDFAALRGMATWIHRDVMGA
jgi:glycosyltransferase involved in cell wall biosynthesis